MKKTIIILAVIIGLPLLMYISNPFGTATFDPRARIFGIVPYRIPSSSMIPTFKNGDYILVSTTAYINETPSINDLIVFKYPNNREIDFVKRVMARGGETIYMEQGKVIVEGKEISQPYVDEKNMALTKTKKLGPWVVPQKTLFVLGDNRDNSNDSRYWGFVPVEDVVGKVSTILYSKDKKRIGKVK